MKKIISLLLIAYGVSLAQWVMFADSKDTYLYNTQTGEIYIRYKKKGKNYQDVFVKMSRGLLPEEVETPSSLPKGGVNLPSSDEQKMQSFKKTQEMMNEALKGSF